MLMLSIAVTMLKVQTLLTIYNPQNEMFNNRKTKRYIFKTKRIFFVSPSIMQIM